MAPRSVTTWSRLEARTRDRDMLDGLRAAVHDPLWLLGRQWQTGELTGEDAGSLVHADVEITVDDMARFQPDSADGPADHTTYPEDGESDPTPPPLETLVEGERVRPATADATDKNHRLAAEAGSHFLRLLAEDFGLTAGDFPESLQLDETEVDDDGRHFTAVVAGRSLDGDEVKDAYDYPNEEDFEDAVADGDVTLPDGVDASDGADRTAFWAVYTEYRSWYDDLYHEPGDDEGSWSDERLEYAFDVSTGSGDRETVFRAADYEGGRLDWDDFQVDHDASLATGPDDGPDPDVIFKERIPTPTRFKGMPAYRWWEIEDDGVDFSAVEAAPEDLSRLLMLEFGLVYGNNWFTLPVDQPTGSVAEVTDLTLETTFNETITVEDAVDDDGEQTTDWNTYSFPLSADGEDRGLFLPPVLASALESDAVEEIEFGRDEMANVGWAIEHTVEGTVGQPRDRTTEVETDAEPSAPVATSEAADVAYQLSTDVPDNWFPLLPRRTDLGEVTLDRGRLFAGDEEPPEPIGRLLTGDLSIPEGEVPRRGKTVSRSYQLTRWIDGTAHLWSGRNAAVSRGSTDSGLAFDQLADPRVGDGEPPIGEPEPMPEGEPISASGELVVASVSPETPGGPRENLADERVVFRNAGGDWLDISGWRVEDEADHSYVFSDGTELAPGQELSLRTGDGEDDTWNRYWGRSSQVWNDDGDVVFVSDEDDELVLEYAYPERPPDVEHERLHVAEIQADSPGPAGENLTEEYVTFVNEGEESLDLSGWRVEDAVGHRYEFAADTTLPAGGTITLRTGQGTDTETDVYWGYERAVWNNTWDTVHVFDDDGDLLLRTSY